MEFPVFLLKNSKRRFITYLILITLFCFFVISIPVNAGLFGEKIKKISDYELKEVIKVELNLSKDPNFYSYTDSMLKEALDKEINSQETPGLTFGSFILNALYEEKLVEMCYPHFDDKESSLFFSKLADNLSDWQENFASKTTKLALQGVIEAYLKIPKLGIGTSTLFLAIDLIQINAAMAKLAKVIARKALFYYLFNRSQGDSHETAWGEGMPPLYDNWQTESFFQSLWNKYGEAILSDNLARFKEEQHEMLIVLILQALNRSPNPPTNMIQFKSDGKTILKIGEATTEKTVILKAKINDPDGNKVKLQIELRRLDEYGGQFDEEAGGLKQSDLFENNSEVMIPIYGLADGDYHWRARAIDEYGLSSKWVSFGGNPDSAIDFSVGQEVVAPVITSSLKIIPDSPYYVGDEINVEFSITNKNTTSITFAVLSVGGRDPDNHVSDFTHKQNISLEPSESYNYQGTLTLNKVGDYHFFCTYQTPDGNWNTCIDLGSGLTDEDRIEDIVVKEKEEPSIVPTISEELYIEWDKTFGGSENDWAGSIIQTSDSGYSVAGYTESKGKGGSDFWIIKLDHQGSILWDKTFGGSEDDVAYSIIQNTDGGYAVAGYTSSKGEGKRDIWVIRFDHDGNMLWDKTFGGSEDDVAYSIIQNTDGSYVVAGYTYSKGAGKSDIWVIRFDHDGNMLWDKTFRGSEHDFANSIIQTTDGGYAVAGCTLSKGAEEWDIWLIKLDHEGNMLWDKTFRGSEHDFANSIIQTTDGGYAVTGYTSSKGEIEWDIWLIKLDHEGNMLWDKTFGGSDNDRGTSLIQTADCGYAIAGVTESKGAGGIDVWVIKLKIESIETPAESIKIVEEQRTESSLYSIGYGKPTIISDWLSGYIPCLPVNVSGPADDLAIILINPDGQSIVRIISKIKLIDNFEKIYVPLCEYGENPPSGKYKLIVKTITPEKIVYETLANFSPPDVQIENAEVELKPTAAAYRTGEFPVYYTLEKLTITIRNKGDLPIYIDYIMLSIPGGLFSNETQIRLNPDECIQHGEIKIEKWGPTFIKGGDEIPYSYMYVNLSSKGNIITSKSFIAKVSYK